MMCMISAPRNRVFCSVITSVKVIYVKMLTDISNDLVSVYLSIKKNANDFLTR